MHVLPPYIFHTCCRSFLPSLSPPLALCIRICVAASGMSEPATPPPARRLDDLFDDAMDAVAALETCRTALHVLLQQAHFAYSDAQREMDRAGLLLGWSAV
ncbi:hypothetical protein DQ04_25251000, partial [Trypanosoma grayi]|uniref:hypothetical protein n=1 Tax=Trypanosoma grayi TaxID=71804 RepID=UPI0004F41860